MHQDLPLFLYNMQLLQLQTDANKAERFAFGQGSVNESKTILTSYSYIFSVTRKISTLVVT